VSHHYTDAMPDFARHLPLSQRTGHDESGVSSDRRDALAQVVEQAAALIVPTGPDRDGLADAFVDEAGLRSEFDRLAAEHADPLARLTALALTVRAGRRRSIRALASAARALLVLARDLHVEVALDPLTAGSAALHASGTAPLERRAAVRGHTVRASDAGWAFGAGPVLTASATSIAAFLLGVSDDPPRPVSPPR
jgi:hypothetical protein